MSSPDPAPQARNRTRPLVRFEFTVDRPSVEMLWQAALAPVWPMLPGGITMVTDGVMAVDGARPAGFAAVDTTGSIPLVLVAPAYQRRGIGTALLAQALRRLGQAGVDVVSAGGGPDYIWPGVPLNLPGAIRFFTTRGWTADHDTLDLVADLAQYRPPAGVYERARRAGVAINTAAEPDMTAVLAFETTTFPSWARSFQAGNQAILVAREATGTIAGALLFKGPGADTIFQPMLGTAAGTIGCVGVAPHLQGRGIGTALVARASEILRDAGTRNCHISWASSEAFYTRAGYRPWQRYRIFRRSTSPAEASSQASSQT
jgi:ribosomal protein S18 acetylase RimI-like enzyme